MKSTIAALSAEVNELRAALQATTSPADIQGAIEVVQNSYSEVVPGVVDVRTAGRGIGRPTNIHKKSLQKLML